MPTRPSSRKATWSCANDARDSSPVEGVITGYSWDFGDGTTAETVIGFIAHLPRIRAIHRPNHRLNDQGGTDDAIATIVVNGAPVIDLSMPTTVRAGDAALLDASSSYDPEGNPLAYSWDLNAREDSDGVVTNQRRRCDDRYRAARYLRIRSYLRNVAR